MRNMGWTKILETSVGVMQYSWTAPETTAPICPWSWINASVKHFEQKYFGHFMKVGFIAELHYFYYTSLVLVVDLINWQQDFDNHWCSNFNTRRGNIFEVTLVKLNEILTAPHFILVITNHCFYLRKRLDMVALHLFRCVHLFQS